MTSCTCDTNVYGSYRIDSTVFPVPATSWEEIPIADGLNGLAINSSYKVHRWTWSSLDASIAKQVFDKFASQQNAGSQLDVLETDPYGADLADDRYGTAVYTDFIITEISPRNRGLPFYDSVQVTFEVWVG